MPHQRRASALGCRGRSPLVHQSQAGIDGGVGPQGKPGRSPPQYLKRRRNHEPGKLGTPFGRADPQEDPRDRRRRDEPETRLVGELRPKAAP